MSSLINDNKWYLSKFLLTYILFIFIPIPKKGNSKEYSNYCIIALISHASKVMLKIFQARLQQCMNCELPHKWSITKPLKRKRMFKLVLEKAEEPDIKLSKSVGSLKNQESSSKHLFMLCGLCQSL